MLGLLFAVALASGVHAQAGLPYYDTSDPASLDALLSSVQGPVITDNVIDVPPYNPPGSGHQLFGNALYPEYNPPIEITIYNPEAKANQLLRTRHHAKRETVLQAEAPSTAVANAVYIMTNGLVYNSILGFNVNQTDGTFTSVAVTATGGQGLEIQDAFAGNIRTDFLDSQGPLRQAGSRLFAVNAANNTMSTFAVNCSNPAHLIQLGEPIKVNGDVPTTLDVAPNNQIVCVGTTGAVAGIQCYTYSVGFGTINPPQEYSGTTVTLNLPEKQREGTPYGPADTLSQVLFTDDENYLIAVVKGSASYNGGSEPGYIAVYPIGTNGFGTPVLSTPTNSSTLFGCQFYYGTYTLFCADSFEGGYELEIDSNTLEISIIQHVTWSIPDQRYGFPSWVVRSRYQNGPDYLTAAGDTYIAGFNQSSGNYLGAAVYNEPYGAFTHVTSANDFVYLLAPGNGTSNAYLSVGQDPGLSGVVSVSKETLLYPPQGGNTASWAGIDVFVHADESNSCDFH